MTNIKLLHTMKNKLIIKGRYGEKHTLQQDTPGIYRLESDHIGISYDPDTKDIISVDPPGGPCMTVGFTFKYRHTKYKIIGFSTLDEPLFIEIEEVY